MAAPVCPSPVAVQTNRHHGQLRIFAETSSPAPCLAAAFAEAAKRGGGDRAFLQLQRSDGPRSSPLLGSSAKARHLGRSSSDSTSLRQRKLSKTMKSRSWEGIPPPVCHLSQARPQEIDDLFKVIPLVGCAKIRALLTNPGKREFLWQPPGAPVLGPQPTPDWEVPFLMLPEAGAPTPYRYGVLDMGEHGPDDEEEISTFWDEGDGQESATSTWFCASSPVSDGAEAPLSSSGSSSTLRSEPQQNTPSSQ